MDVRQAVIAAAGWGTRFLPVTKAHPKELLPLVDKPLIQYAVEEAVASNIQQIIMVTAVGRQAIEKYFDQSLELERFLEQKGENELLSELRKISNLADIHYVRQKEQLGLGHAVLTAKSAVGEKPFALILPDDIFHSQVPVLKQLLAAYHQYQCSIIAVTQVEREKIPRYGIIKPRKLAENVYQILDLVEKPPPEEAPSNLAILGRYILTPQIFEALENTPTGKNQEIQLTDGLRLLKAEQAIYAYEFEGDYYDAGTPLGWLKSTIALAIDHPTIGPGLREYLRQLPHQTSSY